MDSSFREEEEHEMTNDYTFYTFNLQTHNVDIEVLTTLNYNRDVLIIPTLEYSPTALYCTMPKKIITELLLLPGTSQPSLQGL